MTDITGRATRRSLLKGLGGVAVGISFAPMLSACGSGASKTGDNGEERLVNFYNWDTYIGETTLDDFEEATGVKVKLSLYSTNDELFAKLRAGNPGFDVIVPSDEFVQRMMQADMLMPLDLAKIPNVKNIAPEFLDRAFDPGNRFTVPYTWLVLGIGYRKSKVDGVPDSWKWLYDSNQYKGRIALVGEAADLMRIGGRYLGKPLNGMTPEDIAAVEAMIIRQKPNIKTFHDDNGQDLLLSGEVDLVLEYNGDIAQVMTEDPDIGFVVPREGSMMNIDCLAIPKGAPRPDNAHRFINFLLDAEAGKGITETIQYPTPNNAVKALMPEAYRANAVIFPPADVLARCEFGEFPGADRVRMFEEATTRIKAA